MAELRPSGGARGFSLVELLVALVFTMVLMAGMANVYRASLSSFYTSGESISSVRRNRMSLDLLADDLNQACMYLADLAVPPATSATMQPFFIWPNMPIEGSDDPTTSDELYFYVDQSLPFEGRLVAGTTQSSTAELVLSGAAPTVADNSLTIECGNASYVNMVEQGQLLLFKDAWEAASIASTPRKVGATQVSVTVGATAYSAITGSGPSGVVLGRKHLLGSSVLFAQAAQLVRYRVELLKVDPGSTLGIPCLVRDQGNYLDATFTATQAQQIIAENVTGFSVYLSADGGSSWAGLNRSGTKASGVGADGWDQGLRAALDTQLSAAGRADVLSTRATPHWFRSTPILVRMDVTTRTAAKRTEYGSATTPLAYRKFTQSLVFMPRHSGLTLN